MARNLYLNSLFSLLWCVSCMREYTLIFPFTVTLSIFLLTLLFIRPIEKKKLKMSVTDSSISHVGLKVKTINDPKYSNYLIRNLRIRSEE